MIDVIKFYIIYKKKIFQEQYVFVHEALAEALNLNMRPLKPSEYAAFMTSLLQIDAESGKSGLEEQFHVILSFNNNKYIYLLG